MRWSRHHADTPLGELMEEQPDDDTAVRAPLADSSADPAADTTADTTADPTRDADEPARDDSFLDDEDYLPQERTGPGRLTVALVAALVLAVGVLGGVWVQKQLGTSASASAGGFGAGARTGAGTGSGTGQRGYGGTGTGGTGAGAGAGGAAQGGTGQGGAPAGDTSGGTGTSDGTRTSGGTGGTGAAAIPALVGTVTSASRKSLVVTDLGGTRHTVTLSATTTVTTPYAHGALKTGDTVAVAGRAGADGAVTATGLTVS